MTSVYTSSLLIMIGLFQESRQQCANLRIFSDNLQAENEEVRQSIIQSNKNIKEPKLQEKKKENYTNYCNCCKKIIL